MAVAYTDAKPTFWPPMRVISSITNASPMVVTTTIPHRYGTGMIAQLLIPSNYGMQQANKLQGDITVTSTTEFTMPINSTNFDVFTVPSGTISLYAQVLPTGERAEQVTEPFRNVLPYKGS